MTLNELYLEGKKILKNANIEDYAFDTLCLVEHCFNLKRHELAIFRDQKISNEQQQEFFYLINERKKNRPLQYILGYWYFMGKKFKVKDGVLIPRDDTEVLVNTAKKLLKDKKNPKILDLCTGSGIIAITLALLFENAEIFAADVSEIALTTLNENISLHNVKNVMPLKLDVLNPKPFKNVTPLKLDGLNPKPFKNVTPLKLDVLGHDVSKNFKDLDLIVSNPPYIPENDIKHLQKELQFEPELALNGGSDGLCFYRAITENFKSSLALNGSIAFEIGINQSDAVSSILASHGFSNIKKSKDINNIDRVVYADLKNVI